MQHESENLELFIKVAADSIGALRKVDVMRVLESNPMRTRPLANYICRHRPDLAQEVAEVMEEELGIRDWRDQEAIQA
ncbi:hypothetical protein [Noviherbaspirillum pedocola]|jgi:hypothetical protein|uniref:Uncharacterized protein n=1 Tax=Noviherbaspirillum pedocola TaxID=2801341 RepID=A0A934SYZ5_9BURK|nr:hypothetical protein [Noviherbaspirillum pedocola]MBK4737885.1 hypothetical protein [Noviherbaspirillum pedocola]